MHKRWGFALLGFLLLIALSSCDPVEDEFTPGYTQPATPTNTNMPTPTNTTTHTPTPTATEIPCFTLIAPEDGAEYGTMGLITFEWTEQFGSSQYVIEITLPSGNVESKVIDGTSYQRYLESLPPGGEYFWRVTALDDLENTVCAAGPLSFLKPQHVSKNSGGDSTESGEVDPCSGPGCGPGGGTE